MLMEQHVFVVLLMYVIASRVASRQLNNMKVFVRLPASLETRLPKQDHLESSVSL